MRYVIKRKIRKYYKEHIIEWTKPTLSTNPQNGYSLSGTSYGGDIKLISNNLDGGSGYIEVQTTAAYGCLLQYDFPCVVELTNVGVNYLDQYRVNNGFSSFKLVAVLNGIETVISTETPARMNAWYTKNYPINNIRATSIRVYCSCPSAPWLRIGELYITGRQIDTVEVSASDDYDYYEDTVKSYAVKRKTRRYYKYVSQSWTQPTLTANAYSAIQEVSVSDDWDYYVDDIKSYVIGRK